MTFEEYLVSKKIDKATFERKDGARFKTFELLFQEMHPNSFTQQKLFLINKIRRQFPLKDEKEPTSVKKSAQARPKIAPKIKK